MGLFEPRRRQVVAAQPNPPAPIREPAAAPSKPTVELRRRQVVASAAKAPPVTPEPTLAEQYALKFGKPPHHWASDATIRARLET